MKTQVAIIGGGPAGLLLSQLLARDGIDSVILEKHTREHVLSRIRAGVLERGTAQLLRDAGVGENLDKHGIDHEGVNIVFQGQTCRVDFTAITGHRMTVYGQTEVTRDLYAALDQRNGNIFHGVQEVTLSDLVGGSPRVEFIQDGQKMTLQCEFVAGCDGYHGVSRQSMPDDVKTEYERSYPFGWLGLLSDTPPISEELIYAYHDRGFALCSMRSEARSRYYVQVPLSDQVANWSDDLFWQELRNRLPANVAGNLITGPSIEKSIAPLRSFVCEPMRWGNLFLAGDAAHIVPPTGAKGLNLAASDVFYLFEALTDYYKSKDSRGLDAYSERALTRVWRSSRFSWSLTRLLHDFYDDDTSFSNKIRAAEFEYLSTSDAAQSAFAENYVGISY